MIERKVNKYVCNKYVWYLLLYHVIHAQMKFNCRLKLQLTKDNLTFPLSTTWNEENNYGR